MLLLNLDPVPILDTTDINLLTFRDSVQLNYDKIQSYFSLILQAVNPTGTIIGLETAVTFPGYLLLDGSSFDGSIYPDLKTYFGGTTLPDYRGKFLVGRDGTTEFNTLGQTGGAKTITISSANLPTHTHGLNAHTHGGVTGFTAPSHNHFFTGTSSGESANHTHVVGGAWPEAAGGDAGGTNRFRAAVGSPLNNPSTVGVSNDHTHDYSGTTDNGTSINHAHTIPGDSGNTTDGGFANTAVNKLPPYRVINWYIKT